MKTAIPPEPTALAIHESAHVVIAYRLGGHLYGKVWINQEKGEGLAEVQTEPGLMDAMVRIVGLIAPQLYHGKQTSSPTDIPMFIAGLEDQADRQQKAREWIDLATQLLSLPSVKAPVLALAEEIDARGSLNARQVERLLTPWLEEWFTMV
ncbi:MAG: hypothetical protein ACO1QB_16505 [Verrucomicrobiales bacterium]